MSRYESLDDGALAWRIHQVRSSLCGPGFVEDRERLRANLAELLGERERRAQKVDQVRFTVGDSGEFEAVYWPDARVLEVRCLVGGFVCRYKIAHHVLSLSKAEVIARRWADQVLVEVEAV